MEDDVPPDARQLMADLDALLDESVEVGGQVLQVAVTTWAIYGHSTYDGEVIVGEYSSHREAEQVLRTAPRWFTQPCDGD